MELKATSSEVHGWVHTTLGDLARITRGSSPRPIHDFIASTGIPWLKIADATASQDRFICKTKEFIKTEGVKNSVLVEKGDLILSNSATPGIPKIMKIQACIHDGWLLFRELKLEKQYLFYFLKYSLSKLVHSASGSVFKNLKTDIVKELKISLPADISEQKAISKVLSSLDDKIELIQKENDTIEQITHILFKEWFINFNFPDKNGKPYKANGGKMFNSENGEIPNNWNVSNLDGIANISIGRTPPRKEVEWFSKNPKDYKWISIKDIGKSGVFINRTSEFLTPEAIKRFNIPIIPINTVILSFKLTVGRVTITSEDMLSNEAIAHIKLMKNSLITKEFIFLFLKYFDFDSLGSTSSIATAVNSKSIKQIDICIPENSVLEEFQDIINPFFSKIYNNEKQIQTLISIRDTLLPKLLTGQIRVNNG